MIMVRIQGLEWVQGQIQNLMLDNVTTDIRSMMKNN